MFLFWEEHFWTLLRFWYVRSTCAFGQPATSQRPLPLKSVARCTRFSLIEKSRYSCVSSRMGDGPTLSARPACISVFIQVSQAHTRSYRTC